MITRGEIKQRDDSVGEKSKSLSDSAHETASRTHWATRNAGVFPGGGVEKRGRSWRRASVSDEVELDWPNILTRQFC